MMHHALAVPELRALICSDLRQTEAFATLATLAQTAHLFRDTALDALWMEQESILNLLFLIPQPLWTSATSGGPEVFRFMNPITSNDLGPQFHAYAARVKRLHCPFWGRRRRIGDQQSKAVALVRAYDAFALYPSSAHPIFPNLRRLYWNPARLGSAVTPTGIPLISAFLGPQLELVDIAHNASECLPALVSHARTASLLHVFIDEDRQYKDPPTIEDVNQLIHSLRDVKELTLPTFDEETLRRLQHLPALKNLYLTIPHVDTVSLHATPLRSFADFTTLRALQFNLLGFPEDWEQTQCAVRALDGAALESFYIDSTREPTSAAILAELLQHATKHTIPSSLLDFSLKIDPRYSEEATGEIVSILHTWDFLRPLFAFTALQNVELRLPHGVSVDDAFLADIADAWPHIVRLHLARSELDTDWPAPDSELPPRDAPAPRATLLGLRTLATRCRHLTALTLAVDTRLPEPDTWADDDTFEARVVRGEPRTRPGIQGISRLRSFNTDDSPIADPLAVAWVLAALFPLLTKVESPFVELALDEEAEAQAQAEAGEDPYPRPAASERQREYIEYGRGWAQARCLVPVVDAACKQGTERFRDFREWAREALVGADVSDEDGGAEGTESEDSEDSDE